MPSSRSTKSKSPVKPKHQVVKQLDWSECLSFLEKKYNFNACDYAQKFGTKGGMNSIPYLDFWHYIIDTQNPSNGGYIGFDNSSLKDCLVATEDDKADGRKDFKWRATIIEYILKEFGQGPRRECEFHVEW